MDNSSSEDVGAEKKSAETNCAPSTLKDELDTDANIMPETEAQGLEVEKGLAKANVDEKAKPGMMDPSSFPDGGWEAWLAVWGAICSLFCSFGWINGEEATLPDLRLADLSSHLQMQRLECSKPTMRRINCHTTLRAQQPGSPLWRRS